MNEYGNIAERYPVPLSGFSNGDVHLIDILSTKDGKGATLTETSYEALKSVKAEKKVCAVAGDTTSSMTGPHSGMFVQLEGLLGTPLLKTPCRHHSADLEEKECYKTIFGHTTAPQRGEFVQFRK